MMKKIHVAIYLKMLLIAAGNAEIDCLEDLGCVSSQTCDFEEDTCCYTSDPENGVASWKRNSAELLHIKDQTLSTEQGMNIFCVKVLFIDCSKAVLFCGSLLIVMLHVGVCCAVVSVPCSLVVTCWQRAHLLAVVFVVFCHFSKYVLVHIRSKGEVGAVKLVERGRQP